MLVQNSINALISSSTFKNFIELHNINIDACHGLTANIKKGIGFWYYEIYLNYHDPITTANDIVTNVRVNEDGTGQVLNIRLV